MLMESYSSINPNGQNLGTVTLWFRLADKDLNTPKVRPCSFGFALESSLLQDFDRPVKIRLCSEH
jgi:hypothetical protein